VTTSRPLDVVLVGHTARLSGGELAIARQIPALSGVVRYHAVLAEDGPLVGVLEAAGASVEVLALPSGVRDLRRDRVRPGRLPLRQVAAAGGGTVALARRLRALRPDLVHTNTLKAALYGGIAARLAGLPCVWHVRDRLADDYLPVAAAHLVRTGTRWVPNHVVVPSAAILATLGAGARRATVVPDPADERAVAVGAARRPAERAGGLRVGIVGRLSPWKGQDVFLRAFAAAFPDGPERAVVVGAPLFGEDSFATRLHRLAGELGVADRVEFRGFREDVAGELSRLDVLVHASTLPEPFGQVVVEGMAAGLPVVAAAAGGPLEIVTDGVDGVLVPPGDPAALAARLRALAGDPRGRAAMGESAHLSALRYRADVLAPRLLALYRGVLARRSGAV
jgi:glycosyltransferase involved in cell wall biosynthesis